MPPRPFPYPLGTGIDICKVSRVANIIRDDGNATRWVAKVFSRLEWPAIWRRFKEAQLRIDAGRSDEQLANLTAIAKNHFNCVKNSPLERSSCWTLPQLYIPEVPGGRSNPIFENLVQHLAGR